MRQWEYATDSFTAWDNAEPAVSERGRSGWELIGVAVYQGSTVLWFKRPLTLWARFLRWNYKPRGYWKPQSARA